MTEQKQQPARKAPRLDDAERARLRAELRRLEQLKATAPTRAASVDPREAPRHAPLPRVEARPMPPKEPDRTEKVIDYWATMNAMSLDERTLADNLVITAARSDPSHATFDVLRTRLVEALRDKGWSRVAITSPTADCGKSFTAINLAVSLSRYEDWRTVLMDMDLRNPGLAGYLGAMNPPSAGDFLRGQIPLESWLQRIGQNRMNIGPGLAIGLNGRTEDYPAELLQSHKTADQLARLTTELKPDVVLYDLPPALEHDDVIAFKPHFDCVLMVVGGGMTRASDVREAVRRIGEDRPIVGIVLNKAEG
jgi:Mrp family chromosome partitioning ATPase